MKAKDMIFSLKQEVYKLKMEKYQKSQQLSSTIDDGCKFHSITHSKVFEFRQLIQHRLSRVSGLRDNSLRTELFSFEYSLTFVLFQSIISPLQSSGSEDFPVRRKAAGHLLWRRLRL